MISNCNAKVPIASLLVFASLAVCLTEPVLAQSGGRRGGSRGGDSSNPFRLLSRDEVQKELKLTDDQTQRIEQLQDEWEQAGEDQPRPEPLSRDADEAARTAYFAEFRKRMDARNADAMAKVQQALQPNQYQRLQQLRYRSIGIQALASEEISTELKLTEQQTGELTKLLEARRALRFNFRTPREEREKAAEEVESKILAVLSNEQKAQWEAKQGPPLPEEGNNSAPSNTTANTNAKPAPTAPPSYAPTPSDGPAVVSLDGDKKDDTEEKSPKSKPDSKTIQFYIEDAPWEMVLNRFARKAGLTLQILDMPPGSLSYTNDDKSYTPTEALDILHGYMLQMGYVMVKRDRFLVVFSPDKRPIPPNLIPNVSTSDLETGDFGEHELLNVVIPIEGADVNDAAREVEGLKGPQGKVVPLSVTNSLVVMDTYSNLKRIHGLLKGVTSKPDPEELQFKSFPLKHIAAGEAEVIVRDQLGLGSGVTNVSAGSYDSSRSRYGSSRYGSSRYGSSRYGSSSSRSSSSNNNTNSTPDAKVTADPRTNSLLVTATKNQLAIAEQILMTLDVSEDELVNPGSLRLGVPYLRVYTIRNADAREITKTINAIIPGIVINEDGRNDKIHIKATERQHEEVAKLISQMDGTGSNAVAVIPLAKLDPLGAAAMLRSMFATDGDSAPVIEADTTYGRRLMIRGSSDQITQAKLLLSQMGEDGSGTAPGNLDRGPLRKIPLGGRDAEEFARILEQVWGRRSNTPVRVIIPSSNPIRDRVVPSLGGQSGFPYGDDQIPSTQRRSRSDELDQKSTATSRKPLFPVSTEEDQAETDNAKADEMEPLPARVTLRITKAGDLYLNGQAITPLQLSIQAGEWLKVTPEAERRFVISTHPETPSANSLPVLGILSRLGIDAAFKVSETGDPEPSNKNQSKEPESQQNQQSQHQSSAPPAKEQPGVAANSGKLPITMTVRGGELMLYDPTGKSETLNEMEALIEQLALAIPPRTTWTVYYLRSADATETATMLEQLFPASSVGTGNVGDDGSFFGGLTSSFSSMGNSLVDAAGLNSLTQSPTTLRILPEARSNSLFVSGPVDQVNQVEQMLRVLDADELPETLRERVPRMIPVEYANVAEVANIVKEVYHDFLQDNNQRGGRGSNPLEVMMGGGRGSSRGGQSGGNRGPSNVRMTIGVDTQTSKLVVSASDSLFRQVEDLVAELDDAAKSARRTVQVVNVNESNSAVLQQALTALLPNVSVTSTSTVSDNSRSSSSSSSRSSSDDAERRARFFEAMRSRQSDSSSRSTSGSSSSRSFGRGGSSSSRGGYSRGGSSSGRGGYSRGGSSSGRGGYGGSSRGRGGR